MGKCILKLENYNKYTLGTYITIIEEDQIETLCCKILQIMPLDSGKFLIERPKQLDDKVERPHYYKL